MWCALRAIELFIMNGGMIVRTDCDCPLWICKTCKFGGDVIFELNDTEVMECRRNHPGAGFPLVHPESYCWDGVISNTAAIKYREAMENGKERT
jgi:Zn-finger protein